MNRFFWSDYNVTGSVLSFEEESIIQEKVIIYAVNNFNSDPIMIKFTQRQFIPEKKSFWDQYWMLFLIFGIILSVVLVSFVTIFFIEKLKGSGGDFISSGTDDYGIAYSGNFQYKSLNFEKVIQVDTEEIQEVILEVDLEVILEVEIMVEVVILVILEVVETNISFYIKFLHFNSNSSNFF